MSKLLGKRIELELIVDTDSEVVIISEKKFKVLDLGHEYNGIVKIGDVVKLERPELIAENNKNKETFMVIEQQIERIL